MEKGYTKTDGDWIFRYNENDQLHCENGPAAEDFKDGTKHWFIDNQRHRIGGPAIIGPGCAEQWYINDLLHREDGPAYIDSLGNKEWYQYGMLHREDGPAQEHIHGNKYYYIYGLEIDINKIDDILLSLNNLRSHLNAAKQQIKTT